MDPFVVTSLGKKTYRTKVIRHSLNPIYNEKLVFQVLRHETQYSLRFTIIDRDKLSGNDMIGSVDFPVDEVSSLAPEADSVTGLYKVKDPTSFGQPMTEAKKARFRLPLSRSSSSSSTNLQKMNKPSILRSPSQMSLTSKQRSGDGFEQRMDDGPHRSGSNSSRVEGDFHRLRTVTSHIESNQNRPENHQKYAESSMRSEIYHVRSGSTSNQAEASNASALTSSPEKQSTQSAEKPNAPDLTPDEYDLKSFNVPISLKHKERWEDKHQPILHIRAKYLPYQALRQQFWRALAKQYDSDDSGRLNKVELTTMLDSLGSTLRESTIDRIFTKFEEGDTANDPSLTIDQVVIALEEQIRTHHEKQNTWQEKAREALAWSPRRHRHNDIDSEEELDPLVEEPSSYSNTDSVDAQPLEHDYHGVAGEEGDTFNANDLGDDRTEERVVEIRECPICHQPRLKKKSDSDIITHIATCASQDWRQVNHILMAGFVTSSQAGRKWYSKVITRIGYGGYKLGRNSANILVQDRVTGLVNEERMSVYVRLGIRLLYKGLKHGGMERSKSKFHSRGL